jgi:capsid protein
MSVYTTPRYSRHFARKQRASVESNHPKVKASTIFSPQYPYTGWGGDKFSGGISDWIDQYQDLDYWTMRERSSALFRMNMYARGIVRCLVKNIINKGLSLECIPEEAILGYEEDALQDWTEATENRFYIWGRTKSICDYKQRRTFGQIQKFAYREALIGGDVLVINRQDPVSLLPTIEIIPGERVRTPLISTGLLNKSASGNRIVDGVELDKRGRHVSFYVDQGNAYDLNNRFIRISAYGPKTGRLQAWLVYGIDKREDGIRGEPLLSIAMQPLLEIDKQRDSAQRKASINAMIVGFIENQGNMGTLPIQGGAKRITTTPPSTEDEKPITVAQILPGLFMERLAPGEKPSSFAMSGSDVSFGPFESVIVHGLAWGIGIPPENLTLEFQSNYSASQAANSEFSIFIDDERDRFGCDFCDPIYGDWFYSSVLLGKIEAPGFLDAASNPKRYDIAEAWLGSDWTGAVKPSIDIVKQATGYKLQIAEGFCTHDRGSRNINGTKWSKNIRRIAKENQQLMDAMQPIFEAKQKYGEATVDGAMKDAVAYLRSVKDEDEENDKMASTAE